MHIGEDQLMYVHEVAEYSGVPGLRAHKRSRAMKALPTASITAGHTKALKQASLINLQFSLSLNALEPGCQ